MSRRTEYPTGKELCDSLKGKWVPTQRRGKAKCPAHTDDNPSLDIEEKDGQTLVICRSGCTQDAVLDSLRAKGFWPDRRANRANGKGGGSRTIVATYSYQLESGDEHFQVVRFDPKDFRPRRSNGNGGWIWKLPLMRRYLPYRLPDVAEAVANETSILILEGEKDVDDARTKLGVVATCNAGGAGKWREEHAAYLKGADAIIIPHNDDAGRQHGEGVAASLAGIAKRVRILTLPDLPPKGDVSNWIEAGGTAEQLWALVEQAPEWQPKPPAAERPDASEGGQGKELPHWVVDPWPEPVSGAELLDALRTILLQYMVLPPYGAEAASLWILHAWTIDSSDISPFLVIVSPTKQCGKTTFLTMLYWLTPRSVLASNISAASVFRYIEQEHPTLLIDEADSFARDNEELRGILNSGHTRPAARVIRCEGEGQNIRTRAFSTWAPKVVATIRALADTLMDRSIILTMRRKGKEEKVERLRLRDTTEFFQLRQRALRWAADNGNALADADPDVPTELDNRPADNWRPLLAIADLAGGDWPKRAREAARVLSGAPDDDDNGVMLLRDIRRVFDEDASKPDWLGAEVLVQRLVDLEETPWKEWRQGNPISSRGVAFMLKGFSIQSVKLRGPRRYERATFEEAWDSYLAPRGAD